MNPGSHWLRAIPAFHVLDFHNLLRLIGLRSTRRPNGVRTHSGRFDRGQIREFHTRAARDRYTMMSFLTSLLAFLPILLLLLVSIMMSVPKGIAAGLAATIVLFFTGGGNIPTFFAGLTSAFVGTVGILMIIFGAVLLYHVMEQTGYIKRLQSSLATVHPNRTFRFYFLAIFLTAFFEAVSGFGTPGAIVPPLLIAMGYPPVLSIAVVLLIDGLFAMAGAVGTPVLAGLELPLDLDAKAVGTVYQVASLAILLAGFAVMAFIDHTLRKETGEKANAACWALVPGILVPFAVFAPALREISGILSALFLAALAYVFLFRDRRLNWRPWLPYGLLVMLLLLPRLLPELAGILAARIEFTDIYGTEVDTTFQPLRSPLIPFVAASLFAMALAQDFRINLKPVATKTFAVFVVLFPSLAITQLMIHSGGEGPSMIDAIAGVFAGAGPFYPLVSPLLGVIGSFVTGSTTVSNIIFGPVQANAAVVLGLPAEVILGLQLAGGSLGNAVCLFNIIAAATVAGLKEYRDILRINLLPVLAASLLCSVVGYAAILILG
jgi:lactate permease